jgi:HlyB family type I secretion system ABC transporter
MTLGRSSLSDRLEDVSMSQGASASTSKVDLDTTISRKFSVAAMKWSLMNEPRTLLHELPMLTFLPPDARELVVDSFVQESFPFGTPIVREGEEADAFYVLFSGRARVVKAGEGGEEIALHVLRPGDSFGEMALLERTKRAATVRASSDVEVFRLDRSVFHALVEHNPDIHKYLELRVRHRSLDNFFHLYSAFARLPADALGALLKRLEPVQVGKGERVIRQGDVPGPLYVVEEGRLRVYTEENGRPHYLAYLRKGDFFGEMSVFRGAPRTATVEAVSDCRLLRLNQATFQELLKDFPAFKSQIEERIAQYDYKHVARVPLDFAQELLPAQIDAHEKVGPEQLDETLDEAPEESEPPPERPGPFASEEGRFVKKAKRIRRFQHVQQIDEMDCGAACMAMVCRHFGRAVSLARIRQLLHTSTDGTSLRALCRGAEDLGLAARSVKASARHLSQMPLPAIVHWEGNHWVVLYDVDATHVRVADPGLGLRRLPRSEFERKWTGYSALFDYTAEFEKAPVGKSSIAWLWSFFRPFSRLFARALALALIVSALQMVLPVFTQVIVDRVLVEQDVGLLNILILSMVGVMVFSTLGMLIQRYLLSFAAVRIDSATLDYLTRRMLSLPMSYFNTRRTGDIQRRLAGVRQVREFLVQQGVGGLTSLTQLAAALVLMSIYSRVLTLVFLATVPLYVGAMYFSAKWLRPIFNTLEEAFGKYASHQIDAIKGIETVKALGAESSLRGMMLSQFHGLARRQFKADFTMMGYEGSVQTMTFVTTALFLWVGANQVMAGALTIGGLVAFNALVALASGPLGSLLKMWDGLQLSAVLLDRLSDVFEQEPEQGADRSRLKPVKTLEGRIRFEKMGFQYGGPESPRILEGITFETPPGKTVAVVGRSGSGKTTLVKCLVGLLEPTEGTILYDGIDLKTLNYRDLRRQIGFVLQENYLFDDSIARNIAFGEEEPDMDRVLWAARAANAHEFIERLPLGYETRVGESGIAISGGQRQRIAIARALYLQPPVLVFDEATSSLDTESERVVKENLARLLEGRTSFIIAHRLSTIREADMIMVVEKGKIVEQGNHDQLMARQGLYYYLCSQQLGL